MNTGETMKQLIGLVVLLGVAHFGLVELSASTSISSCNGDGGGQNAGVCNCIKSGMRSSLIPEKLVLGGGRDELYDIMMSCKL